MIDDTGNRISVADYPSITIHSDDLDDIGIWLEDTFKIRFDREIGIPFTIRQLRDEIFRQIGAIPFDHTCTTQMAFYAFRNLLVMDLGFSRTEIRPDAQISEVIPAKQRKPAWRSIRKKLSWKIYRLHAPFWLNGFFAFMLLCAFSGFVWPIMFLMVPISLAGFFIANRLGNDLPYKTVGELCRHATSTNYRTIRQNRNDSLNEEEITSIVKDLFAFMNSKKGKVGLDTEIYVR